VAVSRRRIGRAGAAVYHSGARI